MTFFADDSPVNAKEVIADTVAKLQKERGFSDDVAEQIRNKALETTSVYDAERPKHVAPPGAFNLPPLLEKRRLEWQIPDGVFQAARGCLYDRILIMQIPILADTLEDTKVLGGKKGFLAASAVQQEVGKRGAERGIIVGAGLHALDSLRAHGVDLGHIIYFARNTVYQIQVDQIAGHAEYVSLAREGDLILSEDLSKAIAAGESKVDVIETKDENGTVHRTHYYVDREGRRYDPVLPYPEDDL